MLHQLVTMATLTAALAVNFGIPDDNQHPFSGLLGLPRRDPVCRYGGCGATLIDATGLFSCDAQLNRRVVVTAGHCIPHADDFPNRPFLVTFNATPALTFDVAQCGKAILSFTDTWVQPGSALWTPYDPRRPNEDDKDFALIILDDPVPEDVVPDPLPKVIAYPSPDYMKPGPNRIADVGFAGYGIQAWGADGTALGKPNLVNGDRARVYVEQNVIAITPEAVLTSMVAARQQATTCNGDSGSGMFPVQPDSDGRYTLLGTVSSGDHWCRANSQDMRLDTRTFRDYIAAVDCELCRTAGAPGACAARRDAKPELDSATPAGVSFVLAIGLGAAVAAALVVAGGWAIRRALRAAPQSPAEMVLDAECPVGEGFTEQLQGSRTASFSVVMGRPNSFRRLSLGKTAAVDCE